VNGKSIRKRLMRGRRNVFWGPRAYMTVRFSMEELGLAEPPRVLLDGLKPGCMEGFWESDDGVNVAMIGNPSSGCDPTTMSLESWERPLFVEKSRWGGYSWWDGWRGRKRADGTIEREPLDANVVEQHRAHCLWFDALDDINHPAMRLFVGATLWTKTHYWNVDGDALTITYAVKWFYATRKLGFCAALSRAMKAAKRHGLQAHVTRDAL